MIRSFIHRQINEISQSATLRYYGGFLALVHVVTYFFWFQTGSLTKTLSRTNLETPALCWSFFPSCWEFQFPAGFIYASSLIYLFLGCAVSILFFSARFQKATDLAWWSLLTLNLFKYIWLIFDYRAMGNYHYMPFLLTLCYLFAPRKQVACAWLLVSFYVAASFLKLNQEWLSGAALFRNPGIHGLTLEWMCAYVVVLEMLVVWGLLAKNKLIRTLTLIQLILFHAFSYLIVGYFYPAVMTCLLSLFPLMWFASEPPPSLSFRSLHPAHIFILAIFFCAQIFPWIQGGDPALTGRGRLFALNMFDANAQCSAQIFLRFEGSTFEIQPKPSLGPRILCDPLTYWSLAREQCRQNRNSEGFKDLDLFLSSKRTSDSSFTPQISISNFCQKDPPFSTLSFTQELIYE